MSNAWDYSPEPEHDVQTKKQWWKFIKSVGSFDLFTCVTCNNSYCIDKDGVSLPENCHHCADRKGRIKLAKNNQKAPDFLKAAAKHMEDRASTYDKPEGERSMAQTVAIFNLYHGTNLTEAQGWHFMETVKNVRFFTKKGFHRDSGEDGIAYAALKTEAKQREV